MGLPSGYRRLTYIVGNGNQYIDTGLTVQKSDSWRYILEADLVSSDNYAGCNGYLQYQAKIGNGVKSEIDIVYKDITETITVNGTQVSSQNWSSYSGTNVKIGILKLGDINNGWYNGAAQSGKIYFCKIYKSDVLVRDFIPCNNPSNVAGLYDLVDNKFYPSDSSTALIGGPYTNIKTGDILNYDYTGAVQTMILPKGQYKFECWGAQGGYRSSASYGGLGGYSVGTITLTDKTNIFIYVGGSGNTGKTSGGFNGGGSRDSYNGGGGGSDIRIGQDSLYARVIVAGGGGSDGATNKTGMYGGGTSGGTATQSFGSGGGGGTQTAGGAGGSSNGGSFGSGGKGLSRSSGYGGAGGGGWYGGGGSYPDGSADDDRGGGGGSGYVYTASTASNYPSGCLLNSAYYLESASMIAGNASMPSTTGSTETGHSGDGHIRITVIKAQSLNIPVNIGNSWKSGDAISANIGGTWKQCESAYVNINGTWKELS